MKIEITQDCIDKGHMNDSFTCPTALGMSDAGLTDIFVGYTECRYNHNFGEGRSTNYHIGLPKKIQTFIKRFDDGKPVKPISFLLTI